MHTMIGVQRELSANLAVETAFVGVSGRNFLLHRWANLPDRVTGVRPNPRLNVNYYVDGSQDTEYRSWQTSLRKRYSQRVSGSIHYTWGRARSIGGGDIGAYYQGDSNGDVVQDFNNPQAEWGPSTGDVEHYFASEWIYELPAFSNLQAVARHALGGWRASGIFTAQSGEPVNIGQSSAIPTSRADYLGGPIVNHDYRSTLQYLNPAAFAPVPVSPISRATVRPGTAANGMVRTPGAWNVDLSVARSVPIPRGMNLQLRTDMFNALNHTSLTGLRTNITDRLFGQLLNT
jgi:hypothetical protein